MQEKTEVHALFSSFFFYCSHMKKISLFSHFDFKIKKKKKQKMEKAIQPIPQKSVDFQKFKVLLVGKENAGKTSMLNR